MHGRRLRQFPTKTGNCRLIVDSGFLAGGWPPRGFRRRRPSRSGSRPPGTWPPWRWCRPGRRTRPTRCWGSNCRRSNRRSLGRPAIRASCVRSTAATCAMRHRYRAGHGAGPTWRSTNSSSWSARRPAVRQQALRAIRQSAGPASGLPSTCRQYIASAVITRLQSVRAW